jgi:hypothetical protein
MFIEQKEDSNDKSVNYYCCSTFCCPYLWVLLIAKASREVFNAGLCGVVRRDRFWWCATADFWDRL